MNETPSGNLEVPWLIFILFPYLTTWFRSKVKCTIKCFDTLNFVLIRGAGLILVNISIVKNNDLIN